MTSGCSTGDGAPGPAGSTPQVEDPWPSLERQEELAGIVRTPDGGAPSVDPPAPHGELSIDPDTIPRDEESLSGHAPAEATTLYLECEDLEGEWTSQDNVPGYAGHGFVVSNSTTPSDTVMTGEVMIPEPGKYTVWARGFEGDGKDRRWRIEVGNETLPSTHAAKNVPDRFTWQRAGVVMLEAGPVTVRVADVGDSFEIADALVLTLDPEFHPGLDEARWNVLHQVETKTMLLDELVARAHEYGGRVPVPATLDAWQARATEIRPRILRALGLDPLPEATELNAQILGETQMEGYRIQRLVFESRPGSFVTANVYVPDGPGPFPLVLSPVGHWAEGKADPTPAAINHGLAGLGYITIVYDPFGQGELAGSGNSHDEHFRLVLSGHSNMSLMVWSTWRALDYMLTRDDVDTSMPISCTGASGGGLNTLMLSIVDPRIDVSIPVVYVDQYASFVSTTFNHCACSHVPAMASFTDMGEMAALFAPKPQLIMNALGDPMFLDEGVRAAVDQARPTYGLYDADDSLELETFPGGHDYGKAMREQAYGFLAKHVLQEGDGSPVPEPSFTPLHADSEVFECFPEGTTKPDGKVARDFAREWAEEAAATLPSADLFDADAVRTSLVETVRPPVGVLPIVDDRGEVELDGLKFERLRIQVQPGISVPAHYSSAGFGAPAVVLIDGFPGPWAGLDFLRMAHDRGLSALYIATRGQGETRWPDHEHAFVTSNMLLGDSALGQRAFDVRQALRVLEMQPDTGSAPIGLVALGRESALPALFAQAMWHEFDAAAVGPVFGTYFNSFENMSVPLMAYVPLILRVADIPQVTALAAQRPLLVELEGDVYEQRDPVWAWYLTHRATLSTSIDSASALDWISKRLSAASVGFDGPDTSVPAP